MYVKLQPLMVKMSCRWAYHNSPGQLWEFELFDGDAGFAPRGSGHWILNTGWMMALSHSVQQAAAFTSVQTRHFR